VADYGRDSASQLQVLTDSAANQGRLSWVSLQIATDANGDHLRVSFVQLHVLAYAPFGVVYEANLSEDAGSVSESIDVVGPPPIPKGNKGGKFQGQKGQGKGQFQGGSGNGQGKGDQQGGTTPTKRRRARALNTAVMSEGIYTGGPMGGIWSSPALSGTGPDRWGQPVSMDGSTAAAALTASYVASDHTQVDASGFDAVDFAIALTADGSPTLASVTVKVQYSLKKTPSADADWCDYLREEFNIADAPTGNGLATESTYEAQVTVAGGALPKTVGISIPDVRGRWQRILVKGDGTVANVNRQVTCLRR
jgi:hypothetical protein